MSWMGLGRRKPAWSADPRDRILDEARRHDASFVAGHWRGSVLMKYGSGSRRYEATIWYTDREGPGTYAVEVVMRRDSGSARVMLRKEGLFPLVRPLEIVDAEVERNAQSNDVELRLRRDREAAQQKLREVEARVRRAAF